MTPVRYITVFFIITLCLTGGIGVVNYMLDPLGIYGHSDIAPAASVHSRIHKTEGIKRTKPDVVIIGSSRADIGLNPSQDFFPGQRTYNFGLSAATIHEQRRNFEFAVAAAPVKTAILTLDYFAFNALKLDNKQFDPTRLSSTALHPVTAFFKTYGTILSLDTFSVAFKHLRYLKQLERRSYYRPNGHKIHNDGAFRQRTHGAASMFRNPPNVDEIVTTNYSLAYPDGTTSFKHLTAMLDLARKKNIRVILVISPLHQTQLKILDHTGQTEAFQTFKEQLVKTVRPYGYPLWDFATHNHYTREPVPEDKTPMQWFWDTNHYTEALGEIILRRVLTPKQGSKNFGVLLTGTP